MRPEPFVVPGTPVPVPAADQPLPAPRIRVLLIEDDEDDYLITRDMLAEQDEGRFELDWRSDYDDALAAIRRQCHDVYLIDYRLGERTGLQLMREGFADRPSAPVIMLTGQATHEIDLEATALGATDFLVKQELAAAGLERSIRYAISHQTAERHALATRAANDGIWDWDLERDRIYFSPRWHAILGLTERARERRPSAWFDLVAPEDLPRLQEAIDAHLAGHTAHVECEHRLRHADGDWRWVTARGLVTRGVDGEPVRMAGSLSDMTDQRTAQLRLEHEALHDTLTGLPNRTLFMDRVEHLLRGASRDPAVGCAILFVDLDGFKQVNDQLSHAVGDRLLIAVAERLLTGLRPGDTVARLGGDEFTLLLDGIVAPAEAVEIADRLLRSLQQPFPVHGNELSIGASIGVALSQPALASADLLANADVAMYEAKARGRGCIAVFDEGMRLRVADRLARQDELGQILEESLLEIHFQPIVDLVSGRIRALEALARWPESHPPVLAPMQLIAIADETGLIGPLGKQMLSGALRALAGWRAQGVLAADVCVTVNLSARQLDDPLLTDHIGAALAAAGLPSAALKLEITEETMMELERSRRLTEICALGVGFQIDDFGTGHTSLAALHRLPVQALKVDRSFVATLLSGGEGEMMVRSTVALAHSLGLPVIAEGIETAATLQCLRELQCDQGQGTLISPALSPVDVPLIGSALGLAA
ncbi:MAG TPA: EAL domain-containing protein [Solirubrobacteraceae bacterium]|nr:EAL domain-containing protein [Solirubrobacteraceae bacterium]